MHRKLRRWDDGRWVGEVEDTVVGEAPPLRYTSRTRGCVQLIRELGSRGDKAIGLGSVSNRCYTRDGRDALWSPFEAPAAHETAVLETDR